MVRVTFRTSSRNLTPWDVTDLRWMAALVGVIVSALAYAWNNARRIQAVTYVTPEGAKVYQVQGPLFIGLAEGFSDLLYMAGDTQVVIMDFDDSRVVDQSALQAIEAIAGKYKAAGKRIELRHLTRDCHALLTRAGHLIIDSEHDADHQIGVDCRVRLGVLGRH
jgi:SulP family sulfate permease